MTPAVYFTLTSDACDPALLETYASILSPDERDRRDGFAFEVHRHRYLVAHALLRTALSRHAPEVPAERWRFRAGRHGQPRVAGPPNAPPLRFSLSRTDGLVACAIAGDGEVGVDVERVAGAPASQEIAERFFSAAEAAALRELAPAERSLAFARYWTLKEAYVKARGLGLSLPLQQFCFELAEDTAPRVRFADELHDDPARWRFLSLRPTPDHVLAMALSPASLDAPLVTRIVP